MSWYISFYSVKLERETMRLPPTFVARHVRYAERMETFGPDLGMPHTKPLREGLFELSLKGPRGIARIFYCTCVGRRIVMLQEIGKDAAKRPRHRPKTDAGSKERRRDQVDE